MRMRKSRPCPQRLSKSSQAHINPNGKRFSLQYPYLFHLALNSVFAPRHMHQMHSTLSEFTLKATLAVPATYFPAAFFLLYSDGRQPIHFVNAFEKTNGL